MPEIITKGVDSILLDDIDDYSLIVTTLRRDVFLLTKVENSPIKYGFVCITQNPLNPFYTTYKYSGYTLDEAIRNAISYDRKVYKLNSLSEIINYI